MKKNRKTGKKVISVLLSTAMVVSLAGCGKKEEVKPSVITGENEERVLNEILNGQVKPSHSSNTGKEETVYVFADANGKANQVIVSDWLKNGNGGASLADCSDLKDIRNVKGYETFETDGDGNIVWQAEGADIYYRGNTDKEVPVEVKISYLLDGKEITPEELAGKSGRVTIRMDYENKETRKVMIGGKEQEIKVPFAMISGMVLPQDRFSNIEVKNARLLSEGSNSVVVGVALPGLKESIRMEELKEKMDDEEKKKKLEDMEIPDYIEISADTENFELGMTMTVAMSDVLSDIELTDTFDLTDLSASMDDLREATDLLKEGTAELKDGSGQLKDGTGELLSGTDDLLDGALRLKDGTQELHEKSGLLQEGAAKLNSGALELYDGTAALQEGGQKLADGTGSLVSGMETLYDGAGQIKGGVSMVAAQMGTLQVGIGRPVTDITQIADPSKPQTLLQAAYLLNYQIKALSEADGLSAQQYQMILDGLKAQKVQAETDLSVARENFSAAQTRLSDAESMVMAACEGTTTEITAVTGSYTETESYEVTVDAPVYATTRIVCEGEAPEGEESGELNVIEEYTDTDTQTVTGTVEVEKEIVDTEVVEVQSVDVENLQQTISSYQSALEDMAVCQAKMEAYSMQVESLEQEISAAEAYGAQLPAVMQKWSPVIALGAGLEQQLAGISANLDAGSSELGRLEAGASALEDGTRSALSGAAELNNGAGELVSGTKALRDGAAALKDGTGELKDGTDQLVLGTETLDDGAGTLKDGVDTLKEGVLTLDEGMGTLDDGALELLDGMFEFDEEGISKLTDLFGDDVTDVVDRLKAVSDAGKEYNTFTKLPKDMDGSVKFIIKTEAVKS